MEIIAPKIEPVSAYAQLSIARRSFVDFCAVHGDAFKAYKAVWPDVSDASARSQAAAWARDPLVRAALAERLGAVMRRNEVTATAIIHEVAAMAFSSLKNYTRKDEFGKPLIVDGLPVTDFSDLTDDQWAAIKSLKVDEELDADGNVKRRKVNFELHPKNDALDKLMKRFGLYAPEVVTVNHVHSNGAAQVVTVNATPLEAAEMYAAQLRIGQE